MRGVANRVTRSGFTPSAFLQVYEVPNLAIFVNFTPRKSACSVPSARSVTTRRRSSVLVVTTTAGRLVLVLLLERSSISLVAA